MLMSWKNTKSKATARMSDTASGAWGSGQPAAPRQGVSRRRPGILAGARLATPKGWSAVEDLRPGDQVLTFDAGMQTITEVRRTITHNSSQAGLRSDWPLLVPAGALGNSVELTLMPEQTIMVESDLAEECSGDPFALIPATALEGALGIARHAPAAAQELISLHFADDQVVFVNGSALVLCAASMQGDMTARAGYQVLDSLQAQAVVLDLEPHGADNPSSQALH